MLLADRPSNPSITAIAPKITIWIELPLMPTNSPKQNTAAAATRCNPKTSCGKFTFTNETVAYHGGDCVPRSYRSTSVGCSCAIMVLYESPTCATATRVRNQACSAEVRQRAAACSGTYWSVIYFRSVGGVVCIHIASAIENWPTEALIDCSPDRNVVRPFPGGDAGLNDTTVLTGGVRL